jgi:hypothetical protein
MIKDGLLLEHYKGLALREVRVHKAPARTIEASEPEYPSEASREVHGKSPLFIPTLHSCRHSIPQSLAREAAHGRPDCHQLMRCPSAVNTPAPA